MQTFYITIVNKDHTEVELSVSALSLGDAVRQVESKYPDADGYIF